MGSGKEKPCQVCIQCVVEVGESIGVEWLVGNRGGRATDRLCHGTPFLGKSVYNDKNDKVGDVEDLIIAPDSSVSYAIIGVGGFLGLGERQVAIPINRFTHSEGRMVLPGATKDALQAMPSFQYAQ